MFELSKWYADCVSEEGDALIAYSGQLRYRRFSVSYDSVLAPPVSAHSLRRSPVSAGENEVTWSAPALDFRGRWHRLDAEIRETVYRSDAGAVEWHCMLPKAAAAVELGSRKLGGLGYVERLRLTVPPWRLPIARLRWGRFLSERNTLIWIDWEGEFRSRIVYWNGQRVHAASVENGGLVLEDGTHARFDCGKILRQGKLGSTVLHTIPGLEKIAPPRIFLMDECKWLSCATLECAGQEPDTAWCIHEEVLWP
jgi:hypothetical protein